MVKLNGTAPGPCLIPLTRGKFAIVDAEDYGWLTQFKWRCSSGNGGIYAIRDDYASGKRKYMYMHREIMECPDALVVDHINHNPLDNRRENLRVCDNQQNGWNNFGNVKTKTYTGVWYSEKDACFVSEVRNRKIKSGKRRVCGIKSRRIAALIRDLMVLDMRGEFGTYNFPDTIKTLKVGILNE